MEISKAKKVVQVSSNISKGCVVCKEHLRVTEAELGEVINHYLDHGYRLLHVGQETSHAPDGGLWHSTVAVLGEF